MRAHAVVLASILALVAAVVPADAQSHRGHRGHHGWGGLHWGFSPFWSSGWGWGPGWYYPPYPRGAMLSDDVTVVDTDVAPEEALVYLDGQCIGSADDFDGHPDYLYLQEGRYSLSFRLPGYQEQKLDLDASGGMVPVDFRLVADPSQTGAPQPEAPPPTPGQRFFSPKEERRSSAERPAVRPPADRRREIRMREDRAPVATGRLEAVVDLQVLPENAVVYLDGAFIGTASELARMELGVGLAAGTHRIDVMAPGFESRSVELTVAAGERKELDVELDPAE